MDLPVLIMCGGHDPQFPPSCSAELAAVIPGARLLLLEQSGHYPFIEEPGPFWTAVDTFLTSAEPARG